MAEMAVHLVDHVFPPLSVRQWMLSLPKRLRYLLRNDRRTVTSVLTIFLPVVEQVLRERAPGAAPPLRRDWSSFADSRRCPFNRYYLRTKLLRYKHLSDGRKKWLVSLLCKISSMKSLGGTRL